MEKNNYNLTKLYNGLNQLKVSYSNEQIDKLITFYEMVIKQNEVMNLTTITDFDKFVDKHFLDSLVLQSVYPQIKNNISVIDIGTGAGFPGIPLAIMYEQAQFTLLDTLSKRINFIDEVVNALSLNNITTISGRAEDYGKNMSYREQYDLCVTRAVAEINVLSEFTLPFVKIGGNLILYKSSEVEKEVERGINSINILGGKIKNKINITIPSTNYSRNLVVIDKITNIPNKYPRKAGIPKKRPL